MSCAFLLIRSRHGIEDTRRRIELAKRYLPIVPEVESVHELPLDTVCAAFSTSSESARGAYVRESQGQRFVVYNGWFAGLGSSSAMTSSVPVEVAEQIEASSFDDFVAKALGEWALVSVDEQGEVRAATDFLGGEHLYYGAVDGVMVISNRAILCAAALHGSVPAPNPWMLGWLMTGHYAFVSDDETPFSKVQALHPRSMLKLSAHASAFDVQHRPPVPSEDRVPPWDELAQELIERVRVVQRLPDVPFQLFLTGGRDSRLVLSALVAGDCLDRLAGCRLFIDPGHPDAIVGQQVARHYGLPFECVPRNVAQLDLWECLAIHTFQTEMGVHFWDLKGQTSKSREGYLGGNYGEIYWSHALNVQLLGWTGVALAFETGFMLDPGDILTPNAKSFYRGAIRSFLQRRREEGYGPTQVRDRWHRDVRMWRWVGQTRLADGLGMVHANPLPSPRLLNRYLALSLLDQRYGRVHFELMKKCSPWLTEHPFGTAGFSWWVSGRPEQRLKQAPQQRPLAYQRQWWQIRRKEIEAYLLAPAKSDFFEIVDKRRFEERIRSLKTNSPQQHMSALFGALGVRYSLEEALRPMPCRVRPL